jgi:hypothetical protein
MDRCLDDLHNEIAELNARIELLTTSHVLKQQTKASEEVQVKTARTVDWRTKRAELERKYGKGKVREEIVKEISSPAEIFEDK